MTDFTLFLVSVIISLLFLSSDCEARWFGEFSSGFEGPDCVQECPDMCRTTGPCLSTCQGTRNHQKVFFIIGQDKQECC